jgi:CHASE3 domain sensor protein
MMPVSKKILLGFSLGIVFFTASAMTWAVIKEN